MLGTIRHTDVGNCYLKNQSGIESVSNDNGINLSNLVIRVLTFQRNRKTSLFGEVRGATSSLLLPVSLPVRNNGISD